MRQRLCAGSSLESALRPAHAGKGRKQDGAGARRRTLSHRPQPVSQGARWMPFESCTTLRPLCLTTSLNEPAAGLRLPLGEVALSQESDSNTTSSSPSAEDLGIGLLQLLQGVEGDEMIKHLWNKVRIKNKRIQPNRFIVSQTHS